MDPLSPTEFPTTKPLPPIGNSLEFQENEKKSSDTENRSGKAEDENSNASTTGFDRQGEGSARPRIVRGFRPEPISDDDLDEDQDTPRTKMEKVKRKTYDGREIILVTLETQTDWDWVETAEQTGTARTLGGSDILDKDENEKPAPSPKSGSSKPDTQEEKGPGDQYQYQMPYSDEYGIPILDLSSDTDDSSDEEVTHKKVKDERKFIPSVGPPNILQHFDNKSPKPSPRYIEQDFEKRRGSIVNHDFVITRSNKHPNNKSPKPSPRYVEHDSKKRGSVDKQKYQRESEKHDITAEEPEARIEGDDLEKDEQGNVHGMFSGKCEFCQKQIKPFPTIDQQLQYPPESLYCCSDYREFVEFVMSTTNEMEEEVKRKNKMINIKPHEHVGSKQERNAAKEKAVQRMRERELQRRQQEASGLQQNFFASGSDGTSKTGFIKHPPGGYNRNLTMKDMFGSQGAKAGKGSAPPQVLGGASGASGANGFSGKRVKRKSRPQANDSVGPSMNGFTGPGVKGFSISRAKDMSGSGFNGFSGPGTNSFSGQGTNGFSGPGANSFSGPGTIGFSGPGAKGISGSGANTFSGQGANDFSGPGAKGLFGPGDNGISGPGTNGFSGPVFNGSTGLEANDFSGQGTNVFSGPGTNYVGSGVNSFTGPTLNGFAGSRNEIPRGSAMAPYASDAQSIIIPPNDDTVDKVDCIYGCPAGSSRTSNMWDTEGAEDWEGEGSSGEEGESGNKHHSFTCETFKNKKLARQLLRSFKEIFGVARQMKTINYQLSSQKCLEEGWTLRAPSPLTDDLGDDVFIPEPLNPDMISEGRFPEVFRPVTSEESLRERPLIEKFYESGQKFLTMFPDGTGNVFYPSGNLAILISSVKLGQYFYTIHHDMKRSGVVAAFEPNGYGYCYFPNGEIRLYIDQYGGIELDNIGGKKRKWSWKDQITHIHAPPFQPICIGLNRNMAVRVMSQENISLTFSSNQRSCRFNMGARLKVVAPENAPLKEIEENHIYLTEKKNQVDAILDKVTNLLKFPNHPKLNSMLPPLHITAKQNKTEKMKKDRQTFLAQQSARDKKQAPVPVN